MIVAQAGSPIRRSRGGLLRPTAGTDRRAIRLPGGLSLGQSSPLACVQINLVVETTTAS